LITLGFNLYQLHIDLLVNRCRVLNLKVYKLQAIPNSVTNVMLRVSSYKHKSARST